jgi:hypothetical protein
MAAKKAQIVLEVTCRAQGFVNKAEEEEVLNHDQKLLRLQKEIEERESDLSNTD